MSKWQPISSAPTDGTWFMVHDKYCDVPQIVKSVGHQTAILKSFWGSDLLYKADFTYWQPIPEPPQSNVESEAPAKK